MSFKKVSYISLFLVFFICLNNVSRSQTLLTDQDKYWIFFKNKGPQRLEKADPRSFALELGISQRALERRSKMDTHSLIDKLDLPVYKGYLRELEGMGFEPDVYSRWLNGVSMIVSSEKIKQIQSLSFVKKIKPVVSFVINPPELLHIAKPECMIETEDYTYDYGPSFFQNSQIRVPEIHDMGINGKGVLIGMIDSGFDYQGREVFSHLDIYKEYDFHWDDSTTANQENDPFYQDDHGTQTLSVIGGFYEGNLIGPAFGASFMLAKTEWIPTETRIEEDHWVEAVEWMEREGVDIVSTSLGYTEFEGGWGYTYEDINGDTCVTTKAADIAASKGVVVVASAGNARDDPWHYIISPADGDSVIAVGAVDFNGDITSFSSAGPTADGRIKPDVVAMGSSVVAISPASLNGITYTGGTSFSCPLVAGVCALVLQAHPELEPMQVRDAIRETAVKTAEQVDTLYGWGLVDSYEAVFYHGVVFTNFSQVDLTNDQNQGVEMEILWKYAIDPDSVYLHYTLAEETFFTTIKMDPVLTGSSVYRAVISSSIDLENIKFYVSVRDSLGDEYIGPIGAPDVLYEGLTSVDSNQIDLDKTFKLSQNYPNPFNGYTFFPLILTQRAQVKMQIYNIIGQKVRTIYNDVLNRGVYDRKFMWDGINETGIPVTSGLYILKTTVGKVVQTCKIVYVK